MGKSFEDLAQRTMSKESIARSDERTKELLREMLISELRSMTGLTQKQVAEAGGMKQPTLSAIENQSDMQISTLRTIVRALGGELNLLVKFPDGQEIRVKVGGEEPAKKATKKKVAKKKRRTA